MLLLSACNIYKSVGLVLFAHFKSRLCCIMSVMLHHVAVLQSFLVFVVFQNMVTSWHYHKRTAVSLCLLSITCKLSVNGEISVNSMFKQLLNIGR